MQAPNDRIEPMLELGTLFTLTQQENAETQLSKNDGIDSDVALIGSQPLDYP